MKVLFIEAKKKFNDEDFKNLDELPDKIHLLYSIQYKDLAKKIKRRLEKDKQIVKFEQVLGCSNIKPKASLLLIGSGKFHALRIASNTEKEVWIYEGGKIRKISREKIKKVKKKKKARLSKFYSSNKVGILISSKPGQKNLSLARKIKENLKKECPEKEFYLFLSNNIDIRELENFPIDLWINTACPGLESKRIINWQTIKNIKK